MVEVALGLGLRGEVLLPLPVLEELLREQVGVGVALRVEPGARIPIPVPRATDPVACLEQPDGEAGLTGAVELIDADDPGTPDKGEFEFNFTTHLDYSNEVQHYDIVSVDANYGVLPVVFGYELPTQIKFEFPVVAAGENGEPFNVGLGEAKFGLKFNFYRDEHRGIAMALYPQIGFATSESHGVEQGLADPGQTLILPLLVEREFHTFTLVANVGIEQPLNDPERDTAFPYGFGIGRALTRKVAGMFEVRGESSRHFHDVGVVYLNGGIIHGVRNIITYANIGHTLRSDDGLGHTYAGFGVKLLIN